MKKLLKDEFNYAVKTFFEPVTFTVKCVRKMVGLVLPSGRKP